VAVAGGGQRCELLDRDAQRPLARTEVATEIRVEVLVEDGRLVGDRQRAAVVDVAGAS